MLYGTKGLVLLPHGPPVMFVSHLAVANFGQPATRGAAEGDFDQDGVVSLDDFLLLATNFGRSVNA